MTGRKGTEAPERLSTKEEKMQKAALAIASGESVEVVSKKYHLVSTELQEFLRKTFPTDDAKWEFLENAMLSNGALCMKKFQEEFQSMTASEAGKTGAILISKALDIRKSRETGFKEPGISVAVIQKLEKTLAKIAANK